MMKKIVKRIILPVMLAILLLGNPSANQFMNRVQSDFGEIHQGMNLSIQDLNKIGVSSYQSYLVFSRYEYRFGTIKVKYIGFSFTTFFIGSSADITQNQSKQAKSII